MFAWLVSASVVLAGARIAAGDDYEITNEQRDHWAWKRPARPPLPVVRNAGWTRNAIDLFVLAKLEAARIEPAAPASREQLIRRVTLDLIGLPPSLEEIDRFVNDPAADAWEKVIDRLLASPHYGERWGRHWLDVARFAESNGYEYDEIRPDAWRYRDYVFQSFNDDKSYDRFIKEQLAGDEMFSGSAEALVATGFNLLGPDMTDSSDQPQRRQNTLNDMTDTAALAFLGLTVGCARCHDHKFEPIPQTDYYRLQAFFTPAVFRKDLVIASGEQRERFDRQEAEYAALIRPVQEAIARLEAPYRQKIHDRKLARLADEAQVAHKTPAGQRTAIQQDLVDKTNRLLAVSTTEVDKALTGADKAKLQKLREELKDFDGKKPQALPTTLGLQDSEAPPPKTFVLKTGELGNPAEEVQPGYPIVLVRQNQAAANGGQAVVGRRAALAEWIADENNPLTARVMVNRLWQHHFGRGLVATASDVGLRGERPSHPELLDWLAVRFMENGWSIKSMHRLMLISATYRQSVQAGRQALALDPDNKLCGRMNLLRLEGEIIRDCMLAVSGRLNRVAGGPSVFPPIPKEAVKAARSWPVSSNPQDLLRRSVYIFAGRNLRFPFLEAFDLPDSNASCPKRERSTTAPQALVLLNASEVVEAAAKLAERITAAADNDEERITLAYRLALGRRPSAAELKLAQEFLGESPLTELCRGLFNLNEFIYLE
jgi:hypothetical protein